MALKLLARINPVTAAIAALGCAVFAFFLPGTFAHDPWPYSFDSAAYLEIADGIADGRGFEHRAIFGIGAETRTPLAWWPPMYPALVALVMMLGFSATTAGVAVSVIAGLISLTLLAHLSMRLTRWYVAAPLVVAIAASAPFQTAGSQAMSEATFFMCAIASLVCMVEWVRRSNREMVGHDPVRQHFGWLFAAGLFAALTWATRNAGLALFLAGGLFFAAHLLWRRPLDVLKLASAWGLGAAVVVVPWLVRNLVTFGELNPYAMTDSDVSLLYAIRKAVEVSVLDMTTFSFLANLFSSPAFLAAAVGLAIVAPAVFMVLRRPSLASLATLARTHITELFLLAYALAYTALIVLARARYNINEISSRYMVEIEWLFWLLLAAAFASLFSRVTSKPRVRTAVLAGFFSIAALLQVSEKWKANAAPVDNSATSLEGQIGVETCARLDDAVRDDQIVFAVRAYLLRVHCDVNARPFPEFSGADFRNPPVSPEQIEAAGEGGLLWGIVVDDIEGIRSGSAGPYFQDVMTSPSAHPEFEAVPDIGPAMVLKYVTRTQRLAGK